MEGTNKIEEKPTLPVDKTAKSEGSKDEVTKRNDGSRVITESNRLNNDSFDRSTMLMSTSAGSIEDDPIEKKNNDSNPSGLVGQRVSAINNGTGSSSSGIQNETGSTAPSRSVKVKKSDKKTGDTKTESVGSAANTTNSSSTTFKSVQTGSGVDTSSIKHTQLRSVVADSGVSDLQEQNKFGVKSTVTSSQSSDELSNRPILRHVVADSGVADLVGKGVVATTPQPSNQLPFDPSKLRKVVLDGGVSDLQNPSNSNGVEGAPQGTNKFGVNSAAVLEHDRIAAELKASQGPESLADMGEHVITTGSSNLRPTVADGGVDDLAGDLRFRIDSEAVLERRRIADMFGVTQPGSLHPNGAEETRPGSLHPNGVEETRPGPPSLAHFGATVVSAGTSHLRHVVADEGVNNLAGLPGFGVSSVRMDNLAFNSNQGDQTMSLSEFMAHSRDNHMGSSLTGHGMVAPLNPIPSSDDNDTGDDGRDLWETNPLNDIVDMSRFTPVNFSTNRNMPNMLDTSHFNRDLSGTTAPTTNTIDANSDDKPNRMKQWYYYIIYNIIALIIWALASFLLYTRYGVSLVTAIASSRIVLSIFAIALMGTWMNGWHLKRVFIIESILITFSFLMIAAVKQQEIKSIS